MVKIEYFIAFGIGLLFGIFLMLIRINKEINVDKAEYVMQQIESGQENMKYFNNNMTINQAILTYKVTKPYSKWYLERQLKYVCGDE